MVESQLLARQYRNCRISAYRLDPAYNQQNPAFEINDLRVKLIQLHKDPSRLTEALRLPPKLKPFSWQRMIEAVEAVRERALRATAALRDAGIPYAVAGGNAVAAWVARVDITAVRNTKDVDILVQRSDFDAVKQALESVGFIHHELMGVDCFIDGPDGSPRDGVHLLYAGEKVRPEYPTPSAEVTEVEQADDYQVVALAALVRMKLNSFRDKDRTHLRDFLEVGLVDETWLPNLPPDHAAKLQQLIDDPHG